MFALRASVEPNASRSVEQRERTVHKATLFGMYVRQAMRGRGIGRLLVEHILRHAQGTGRIEVVQLTVSQSNLGAMNLYARCGFVPFGTEPMAVKLGDGYITKAHMWHRVTANAP